jgi:GntR family transcriptional regulator/MocR family aminotransferase
VAGDALPEPEIALGPRAAGRAAVGAGRAAGEPAPQVEGEAGHVGCAEDERIGHAVRAWWWRSRIPAIRPPARLAFAAAGAAVVGVAVDDEGLVVEALPDNAEVVYVTPSHQFPLGAPLSPRRRQALLAFARRSGAVVVEDDYDGEFRFDGRPLEALQTLDASGQVVYVGTFAKSLFPELRLGYLVAPEWLRGPLRAAKQLSGLSPLIDQQTLAAFIAEGHLARHVRRVRRHYAERRAALLQAIGEGGGRWLQPYPSAAGLHLALRLPEALDARRLLEAAADRGVGAYAASQFALDEGRCNAVVLGYGALPVESVRRGAQALLRAAERVMGERA